MYKLNVTKKTGFVVKDIFTPIIIRDMKGIMFYNTESLIPKVTEFNLPEGQYLVDGGYFAEKTFPVMYKPIWLPFRERFFYPDPKKFTIRFAHEKNKCAVNWTKKTITFDNSFKERPLSEVEFIMYHEFGHRLYTTEKYCDLYAAKCMLKAGYNPSQIGLSSIDSLSDNQDTRKLFIINKL